MVRIIKQLLSLKNTNNDRNIVVKKHAFLSLLFKGLNILISLLLVPLSIAFIGKDQYGIWLTVSSVIAWLAILDIGMGHGLRNNLVQALVSGQIKTAKIYVSTTYVVLTCIMATVLLFFFGVNSFIDWSSLLNISPEFREPVSEVVLIVVCYFCLSFILKIVNSIFFADQKAAYTSIIDTGGQLFALASVYLLNLYFKGSLIYLCLAMCLVPFVFSLFFNFFVFNRRYKLISPSFKYFRFWCIKQLIGLSLKFFVIQIAVIVQYQTANFVIANFFKIGDVTSYNIVFKYFSVLSTFFAIIVAPLWSAATDAYNQGNLEWIRNIVRKYLKILLLLGGGGMLMLCLSDFVYNLWIMKWVGSDNIKIDFSLSFWCLIYTLVSMFGCIFVNILNGIGAIRIQFILSIITPVLYLLLCLLFFSYLNWGVYAIFIASIIANINGFIIAPFQYFKVFYKNKKGIWTA